MKKSLSLVYLAAGLISLLLSFWFACRETVINPDAICYLQSASDMSLGLNTAMHVCDQAAWPFYSVLIYGWVTLTHISFQMAAFSLNGLFSLISVVVFLAIINYFTKNPRILWFAALVILLSHEFNSVRQYIVRDHGFWAFYLLSIFCLLQFFRNYQFRYALLWSASLIIATLFRVEGAVFLLLVPFLVWFDTRAVIFSRCVAFIKLNILSLIAVVAVFVAFLLHTHFDISRLHEVGFQFSHGGGAIIQHFQQMKAVLAKDMLTLDSAHDAGLVLFLMLTSWYFVSVISNLSVIYFIGVVYAVLRQLLPANNKSSLVLGWYVLINIVITAGFFAEHLFLSKRYLIALSLVLMIWVPFFLDDLYRQYSVRRWPFLIAIVWIILSSLGGIFDFGYSKKYLHDAGDWLSINVPQNATLYSNDYQVMYYSHHFGDAIFTVARDDADISKLANNHWQDYQFIAVRLDQKDIANQTNIISQISYPLVKVFQNKRGDQVRIYRRIGS